LLSPEKLSDEVKNIIINAQNANNLYICDISLWEIAMLAIKKRINIYEPIHDLLNRIQSIDGLSIIAINADIAAESVMLADGFYGDPADCIIVASTRKLAGVLVSRDQKIIDWSAKGNLKLVSG